MIKTVTRALYIDGKPIAEFTQDPLEWSELADLENITARMELLEVLIIYHNRGSKTKT